MKSYLDYFMPSLTSLSEKFFSGIPVIVGAILIFLFGWLIARLLKVLANKLLTLANFDSLCEKINVQDYLNKANYKASPSSLISKFVYWVIMLITIISVSESLGWTGVSTEISKLLGFLPKILIASILFFIGSFIANLIRNVISGAGSSLGIGSGKMLGSIIYYIIMIMVTLTALEQLGINTAIISSNLILIVGLVLGSAAISYGFASRKMLSNILGSFYAKKNLKVGQTIEIDSVKGEIIEVNNLSIKLKTDQGVTLVPSTKIFDNNIIITNFK